MIEANIVIYDPYYDLYYVERDNWAPNIDIAKTYHSISDIPKWVFDKENDYQLLFIQIYNAHEYGNALIETEAKNDFLIKSKESFAWMNKVKSILVLLGLVSVTPFVIFTMKGQVLDSNILNITLVFSLFGVLFTEIIQKYIEVRQHTHWENNKEQIISEYKQDKKYGI